ncbi:hypothetical protein B0H14DRAFT_3425860 [Mycena olivaceomarginata]|nr:hypothetical protein B0H14DRAFT_3425860 [Mycena olivaceomarginata]
MGRSGPRRGTARALQACVFFSLWPSSFRLDRRCFRALAREWACCSWRALGVLPRSYTSLFTADGVVEAGMPSIHISVSVPGASDHGEDVGDPLLRGAYASVVHMPAEGVEIHLCCTQQRGERTGEEHPSCLLHPIFLSCAMRMEADALDASCSVPQTFH